MPNRKRSTMAVLLTLSALALAACGESSTVDDMGAAGNGVDRAFVAEMIAHHRSAVEMAEVARERSQRTKVRKLADDIIENQNAEIETMRRVESDLEEAGVERGDLGLEHAVMGMDMEASMLHDAKPFDREFIDMMILHHQGAIRMARAALAEGQGQEVRDLANAIIDAQSAEIDQMNEWRVMWYGELSPTGGVPTEGDPASGHAG